uniref:Putative secreted protein n=1 Tax=Ixodes ricinus TaxID=34613 RepID=A0A6B0UE63_IXORI
MYTWAVASFVALLYTRDVAAYSPVCSVVVFVAFFNGLLGLLALGLFVKVVQVAVVVLLHCVALGLLQAAGTAVVWVGHLVVR